MRPNPFHLSGCALSIHLSFVGCLHHRLNRNNRILLEISHGFDFRILTFIATRALFNIHILLFHIRFPQQTTKPVECL